MVRWIVVVIRAEVRQIVAMSRCGRMCDVRGAIVPTCSDIYQLPLYMFRTVCHMHGVAGIRLQDQYQFLYSTPFLKLPPVPISTIVSIHELVMNIYELDTGTGDEYI